MSDSDDDFDDDFDDELDQVLNKTAVNRQVQETIIRRNEPVQRTLMGDRADRSEPVEYEEVHRKISYGPTHHKTNPLYLNTFIYPSNLDIRDYQYDIIHKSFYKNLLCAIPTGMGKTFIASTVMLNYYRWFKEGKIIFMAPTRPLIAQQIQACLGVTDIPSGDTAILLDKSRKNRPDIWNSKRVFFTTPQVVENDLKAGILNPKEIVCLVVDEAHRARGNYSYTNVVQFIDRFNTSYRVLALTATPAADIEGVQEVVNNLHISKIEIRTEESIDIVKYMKRKETVRINVGMNSEMQDIMELLGYAIDPILKQANEANIYDVTDPSKINFFLVMQKSQAIIKNPTLNEGLKWKYYFILQVIGYVGQMMRRLKIYGVRTFYSYYQNKCKEFRTKYSMGKSTNKTSAEFFYHDALKKIEAICDKVLADSNYVSHPKLEHMIDELLTFFQHKKSSRVIVFTELRESALEIVKCIDSVAGEDCKAHIFIGQAKAKEGFDEDEYVRKNAKKGRGKKKQQEREEREREAAEKKNQEKEAAAAERAASRTATSEEAQLQGMNQKTQKELIRKFKKGEFNVLVATSIGEEGLDIGEVDLIICYDSTSSPIKNIQRMGRTGRKNDGKVILLLAGTEELKFDQSMEGYAFVQKQIAQNCLDMQESDRIIPKEITPRCVKQFIDIPEENLAIAKGEDEEEVIKYSTQAMLGKLPKPKKSAGKRSAKNGKLLGARNTISEEKAQPKITKRFFMPDNVETGFVQSSKLVKKVSEHDHTSADTSISLNSDSQEDDESTSASRSIASNNSYKRRKTSGDSSVLNNLFSSPSASKAKSKNSPNTSANSRSFFRPAVHEVETVERNDALSQGSISGDGIEKDLIAPEPVKDAGETENVEEMEGIKKIEEAVDVHEDQVVDKVSECDDNEVTEIRSDSEYEIESEVQDEFPKALTPEYEKDYFLNSSPKITGASDESDDESDKEELKYKDDAADDELEVRDAKESSNYSQKTALPMHTSIKPQSNSDYNALDSILSFKAFEDNNITQDEDQDVYSYVQPYKEAQKIMDKQYENDPEFSDEASLQTPDQLSRKLPAKSKVKKKSTKKRADISSTNGKITEKAETPQSKIDITNLLKSANKPMKRSLGASRRKVDISKIQKDQIIDLDLESDIGSQSNLREVISRRKKKAATLPAYMSQNDTILGLDFSEDDGFLTEKEKKEFFSEYYTSVEIDNLSPDPTLSARKFKSTGDIRHSRPSQRFMNFIHMIRPSNSRGLDKLILQLNQNKNMKYIDEISSTDVIVQENEIEYVKPDWSDKKMVPIEVDDDSDEDSLLDNERPGDAGFTSISLLSDDDEFKSL